MGVFFWRTQRSPLIQNMKMGLILNQALWLWRLVLPSINLDLQVAVTFHQKRAGDGDWTGTGQFGCKCIEKINIESLDLEKFRQESLRAHNAYRSKHGVPALKLSDKVNAVAQEWADYLIANDGWQHSGNKKYGENIYMSIGSSAQEQGQRSVDSWYSEIKDYKFENPGYSQETGHFTQVVW